jgi:hypothetical protein
MSNTSAKAVDVKILEPDENRGYLPLPIPAPRDGEIVALLSQVVDENRLAGFARQLVEGHARVLRVFAERAAAAAVRNSDPALLRLATIGLLLSWRGPDSRETLLIFPLIYDAIRRMGIDIELFVTSIRQIAGDQLVAPLIEFLKRSERDKSLQVMGYTAGTDRDGFRYVRNW